MQITIATICYKIVTIRFHKVFSKSNQHCNDLLQVLRLVIMLFHINFIVTMSTHRISHTYNTLQDCIMSAKMFQVIVTMQITIATICYKIVTIRIHKLFSISNQHSNDLFVTMLFHIASIRFKTVTMSRLTLSISNMFLSR